MDSAIIRFNELSIEWGIRLPPRDFARRRRGRIFKAGWSIWYLCGDEHTRFYADGAREDLDAIIEFRRSSPDPSRTPA